MTDELELCGSAAMQSVRDIVAKVACTNVTVLLLAESGVGKEVSSNRSCLANEKGAFRGADPAKLGKFELATSRERRLAPRSAW